MKKQNNTIWLIVGLVAVAILLIGTFQIISAE